MHDLPLYLYAVPDRTMLHYQIESKIGEGGMGEVYLATDTKLDRRVALKFLPESLHRDEEARLRLLREARAVSKLSHANIVTIYAVEEHEGRDFIAMEYIDGLIVSDYIQQKNPSLRDLLGIGIGVAQGLQKAHEAGIVHRDLKPGNIIVDRDGKAKILDFGVAKIEGATRLTETGSTVGTIAYMSPEQTQGSDVDARSDIFSLGAILYELIAGQAAFRGEHKAAVLYAIANENPDPVARFKSDAPDELQRILTKCLEKDPNNRYQSTADLVTDLKQLRRAMAGSSATVTGVTTTAQSAPSRPSRNLLVSGGIAVVLLILALVFKPWNISIQPTQEAVAVENRLAIMYFDNIADSDDTQRLGEIAANLLITNLSELSHLDVVSNQRLYDLLKQLGHEGETQIDRQTASEVARLAQARWMLQGSILQTSPSLVVTAQIVDVTSGSAVASQRVDGEEGSSIFALIDELTTEVRADLELPAGETATTVLSLAENMATSPEAYRHFLDGVKLHYQYRHEQAAKSYGRAIELDSTFAMAYYSWATMVNTNDRPLAQELSGKAMDHIDRASPREQNLIKAFDASINERDPEMALRILTDHVSKYPADVEGCFARAFAFRNLDQLDSAAACLERVLELDPMHKESYNQLAYRYHDLGKFDQAIWAINKYIELAPNEPNPYDSRADLYAFQGMTSEARRLYAQVLEMDPDFFPSQIKLAWMMVVEQDYDSARQQIQPLLNHSMGLIRSDARFLLAVIWTYQGKFREALKTLDQGIAANELEGLDRYLDDFLWAKTLIQAERGDTATAVALAREAPNILKDDDLIGHQWMHYLSLVLLASTGDTAQAHHELERIEQLVTKGGETPDKSDAYQAGLAALAEAGGDYAAATDHREEAVRLSSNFFNRFYLGRSYLRAGRLSHAVDTLASVSRRFDESRAYATIEQVTVHYSLGLAYESSGWADKAIEQYETFLGIWRDADPGLAKVADARARLERLSASS